MKSDVIKVALFGVGGRMGSEVAKILSEDAEFQLKYLFECPDHPLVGKEAYSLTVQSAPEQVSPRNTIFCDFTTSNSALLNADLSAKLGCPILIGTTGFTEGELAHLEALGAKIPIMIAPNLSLGVHLLYKLSRIMAEETKGAFSAEIIDIHHKWKKDAPSGTALQIARIFQKYHPETVPIHSLRMGDIVGEHRIVFAGEGETIEIVHRATSRRAFAVGVPIALKFLSQAPNGNYSFKDALEKISFG